MAPREDRAPEIQGFEFVLRASREGIESVQIQQRRGVALVLKIAHRIFVDESERGRRLRSRGPADGENKQGDERTSTISPEAGTIAAGRTCKTIRSAGPAQMRRLPFLHLARRSPARFASRGSSLRYLPENSPNELMRRFFLPFLVLLLALASCQSVHRFVQPRPDWQTRVGQLQYRSAKTSLIGEVLVRYDSAGDFELTFSKGPGLVLLMVRQDANFVRVSGPLARGSWSGAPAHAPIHLRGWISLRDELLREKTKPLIRRDVGSDSFTFAF